MFIQAFIQPPLKLFSKPPFFKAFPFHDLAHESKFSEDVLGRAGNLSYFSASEQIYLFKEFGCMYICNPNTMSLLHENSYDSDTQCMVEGIVYCFFEVCT